MGDNPTQEAVLHYGPHKFRVSVETADEVMNGIKFGLQHHKPGDLIRTANFQDLGGAAHQILIQPGIPVVISAREPSPSLGVL